jgi:hypothetical protein
LGNWPFYLDSLITNNYDRGEDMALTKIQERKARKYWNEKLDLEDHKFKSEARNALMHWMDTVEEVSDHLFKFLINPNRKISFIAKIIGGGDGYFDPGTKLVAPRIEIKKTLPGIHVADTILFESCNAELASEYGKRDTKFRNDKKDFKENLFGQYGTDTANTEAKAALRYAKFMKKIKNTEASSKIKNKDEGNPQFVPQNKNYKKLMAKFDNAESNEAIFKTSITDTPHDSDASGIRKLFTPVLYEITKVMSMDAQGFKSIIQYGAKKPWPSKFGECQRDMKIQWPAVEENRPQVLLKYQKRAEEKYGVEFKKDIVKLFSTKGSEAIKGVKKCSIFNWNGQWSSPK